MVLVNDICVFIWNQGGGLLWVDYLGVALRWSDVTLGLYYFCIVAKEHNVHRFISYLYWWCAFPICKDETPFPMGVCQGEIGLPY